ncbi:MAG: PQQ-binding-like beta-propeller repeat protein [Planctomycetota bacterium]
MPHASIRLPLAVAPLAVALFGTLLGALSAPVVAQDWPHWRGPHYNGASEAKELPQAFGPEQNVRWAATMPGPGASTPIVLGDRVFVTSVDSARERLVAICLDRKTGEVVWQRDAGSGYKPTEQGTRIARGARTRATYASPSPVSDGQRVVFFFGNGDLVAYDFAGEELWRRNIQQDYGNFAFNWTFAASPTYREGLVYLPVLQRDVPIRRGRPGGGRRGRGKQAQEAAAAKQPEPIESFVLAVDVKTGKNVFRHVRPSPAQVESLESDTTMIPFVGEGGREEMLLVGGDVITGHDPKTGKELWRWGTWNEGHRERFWRLVPSVVVGDGLALVCAPKRAPVYAVRLGGSGELDDDAMVWKSGGRPNPVSSDVPTPAFHDGCFFVLSDVRSAISRVRATDGEVLWTTPMPKDHLWRASPTVADGRVWCIDHNGLVIVLDAESGKVTHQVAMGSDDDDHIRSSIVVAHGDVLIRTNEKLFCVGR